MPQPCRLDGKTIVICYPVSTENLDQIRQAAPSSDVRLADQQNIDQMILDADIFCGHAKEKPLPWAEVVQQGRLQWIQSSAAGMDHCLVPEVIASEIPVTSASGLFANQVAEQTFALLFGVLRNAVVFYRQQQARQFVRRPTDDLHGKTVGIIGFGGNGRRIAKVLSPFSVRILATDMFPVDKPTYVEQLWDDSQSDRLLSESDVVILALPLNSQTAGMFDSARFARMKKGSYLINVARGKVVSESALNQALNEGTLLGAGLDVTEEEPLAPDSQLWDRTNVIITPHVGAQSAHRVNDTTDFFCQNLARYRDGQPLLNLVDKPLGFPRPEHRIRIE